MLVAVQNYTVKDWMGFVEVYGILLRVEKYEPEASKADRLG
jgi:phage gp29-like protein